MFQKQLLNQAIQTLTPLIWSQEFSTLSVKKQAILLKCWKCRWTWKPILESIPLNGLKYWDRFRINFLISPN